MRIEEKAMEWLKAHNAADEIVMDAKTKLPVLARYLQLKGVPRRYPVDYFFDEEGSTWVNHNHTDPTEAEETLP